MDRWQTIRVPLSGGLRLDLSPLEQGTNYTGSLTRAVNFEPSASSGYRRLSGYTKWDSTVVPGTGDVLGAFVWNGVIIAARGQDVYSSSGSGWTKINGAFTRPSAGRYTAAKVKWGGTEKIVLTDGVNKAAVWDGTTWTEVTHASAPTTPKYCIEHRNHMFLSQDDTLYWSVPYDATNFAAGSGAGSLNVGFEITGMGEWRDALYVFGFENILKITGSSSSDFATFPISKKIGCIDGHTIQEIGGDLVYLSHTAIRTIAGTERNDDVELGSVSEAIRPRLNHIDRSYASGKISSVTVPDKAQYRLFTNLSSDDPATAPGYLGALRYDSVNNHTWEWFELEGFHAACADSGHISNSEVVVFGGYDGYVYRMENGDTRNGSSLAAYFATPFLAFDDPALRKVLQKMEVFAEVEGQADIRINVQFDYNDETALQPPEIQITTSEENFATYDGGFNYNASTSIYGESASLQDKFNLVGSGLNCSFIFSSNDALAPYTIKELVLRYSLQGGR